MLKSAQGQTRKRVDACPEDWWKDSLARRARPWRSRLRCHGDQRGTVEEDPFSVSFLLSQQTGFASRMQVLRECSLARSIRIGENATVHFLIISVINILR